MTDDWGEWEVVRRQVAVCGRISPALVGTVDVRVEGKRSATTASVRHDGIYFCLDLPSGEYRVAAVGKRGDMFGGGTADVSRNAAGDITFGVVDIKSSSSAPSRPRLTRRKHSQ